MLYLAVTRLESSAFNEDWVIKWFSPLDLNADLPMSTTENSKIIATTETVNNFLDTLEYNDVGYSSLF